jgi:uncharacterized DUF497 family protein
MKLAVWAIWEPSAASIFCAWLALFRWTSILIVPSKRDAEERLLSIVPIEGKLFAVIWMWREDTVRTITVRRTRDGEEKRYRAVYG